MKTLKIEWKHLDDTQIPQSNLNLFNKRGSELN
jgi:hypothetical protein